mgnify:CR=1 FL=1|tara:strand:+ start:301 stop:879 length:579 start_codon:yes stop_codon:yes gene_type:complete
MGGVFKKWVDMSVRPFFVVLNVCTASFIVCFTVYGDEYVAQKFLTPSIILFGALLATTGWLWSGHLSRKLNRKQQAVNLLLSLRQPHVNEWKKKVYNYIDNHADGEITQLPIEEIDKILGFYEFISIAVMNGTADEEIIKESQRYVYIRLYEGLRDYIDKVQKDEVSIYCHFSEHAKKWNYHRKMPSFVRND